MSLYRRFGPLVLFCAVFALYAPSARNGFIYDDQEVIVGQHGVRDLPDLARVFEERHFRNLPYYRPVTRATLLLERAWHGDNPAPYHLFNALLMGAAAVAAYALLRLPVFGIHPVMAIFGAAVFALHPAASSCVYPISSGRESLLPALLIVLAVYAWLRGWAAAAWVLFAAALFSRESAVVVPLLFVTADALGFIGAKRWSRYLPVLAILPVYIWIRHGLFGETEYVMGSAAGPFWSIAYALQTIVAPFAALVYEPAKEVWLSLPRLALAVAAAGAVGWLAVRRNPRAAAFWLGWFVLTLLPTANLLKQETAFDERYVLLASLGLVAAACIAAGAPRRGTVLVAAAVAAVCAGVTVQRAATFHNDAAFSEQWLRSNPRNADAWFNMGSASGRTGKWDQAVVYYAEACRLRPEHVYTHNNFGDALLRTGRVDEAIAQFQEAVRLQPSLADAHLNLGIALARTARLAEATPHLAEAARLKPDLAEAHGNLGIALAQQGQMEPALAEFERAVELKPDATDLHNNLANALAARARYGEAIAHYREALRLDPGYSDAERNLAMLLRYTGEGSR